MSVHQNSIDCYHAEEPKLSRRAAAVLAWVSEKGPKTDREIAYGMGFGENLNAVRPRITELIEAGKLMEVGDVQCSVTKKRVRRVDLRRPRQAFFAFPPILGTPLPVRQFADETGVKPSETSYFSVGTREGPSGL